MAKQSPSREARTADYRPNLPIVNESITPFEHRLSIRPISSTDFEFVRDLASKQPHFTVPSEYILWFAGRANPDYCLIATNQTDDRLGYILAMREAAPDDTLFIWQIASTHASIDRPVAEFLISALVASAARDQIRAIHFTIRRNPFLRRWATRLATKYLNVSLVELNDLSTPLSRDEAHFAAMLDGNPSYRSKWNV